MITFKQFLIENNVNEISNQNDYENIKKWISTLDIPGRAPRGLKVEFEALRSLKTKIETTEEYYDGKVDDSNTRNILNLYLGKLDVDKVNAKFGKATSKQPSIVKKQFATYKKDDARTYKRFLDEIDNIEDFLSSLKGFHAKALPGLKVQFVSPRVLKSVAKYIRKTDTLQINLKKVGNTREEYGSLRYIILHELGHRYLVKFPQRWDIDQHSMGTTKYSYVDSFSGEEKFAELYAISHWPNKYSQHKDKIDKFINIIN